MNVGIGYSRIPDSQQAVEEALRQALKGFGEAAIAFLFTTKGYDQEQILESVRSELGDSRLVGASGAGIVTPEGILQDGIGIMVLSDPRMAAFTASVDFRPEAPGETGRNLGQKLLTAATVSSGTVFVFPDGLAGNITLMLRGLYEVMGPEFHYVGGGTGDNLRFLKTYQFTENGVSSSSVVAALVTGLSVGTGIGHGWEPEGSPLIITKARNKTIHEFDERPAFNAYSERLGGIELSKFPEYGMRHPLGIPDALGRFIIRDPLRALPDGSLELVTEVPSKAVTYIMKADKHNLSKTVHNVFKTALGGVRKPEFALVFDCVSRHLLLKDQLDEVAIAREVLGPLIPIAGLLTFGEVGAYTDVPLFHNKTLVVAIGGE